MSVRPIITFENPRLRKTSIKIKRFDAELQTLIDDMIDTMRAAEGIGLAAPQVGVLLRLIVIEFTDEEDQLQQTVLVNPEITGQYGEWMAEEGCLSIPGYLGTVPRAEAVDVKGKTRTGKDVRIKADGTLAHVLQHEIDHLDGVLYIDYLASPDDLRKTEPGRRRRRRRGAAEDGDYVDDDGTIDAVEDDGDMPLDTTDADAASLEANPEPATVAPSEEASTAAADPATPRGTGTGRGSLTITRDDAPGAAFCCDICGHA